MGFEVLHSGGEVELRHVLRISVARTLEAMMCFQVRKAHFHFLTLVARLVKLGVPVNERA